MPISDSGQAPIASSAGIHAASGSGRPDRAPMLANAWAALRRGAWPRPTASANVVASLLALVLLAALPTPRAAADEARGNTPPSALGSRPDPESRPDPKSEPALSHARIYPPGARLPASFRNMPWRQMNALDIDCMFDGTACEIYTLRRRAGVPTYILIGGSGSSGRYRGTVFAPSGKGKWYRIGMVEGLQCPGVLEALRAGRARTVPPLLDDLLVAKQRLLVKTFVGFKTCDGPFEELDVDGDQPPDPRDR